MGDTGLYSCWDKFINITVNSKWGIPLQAQSDADRAAWVAAFGRAASPDEASEPVTVRSVLLRHLQRRPAASGLRSKGILRERVRVFHTPIAEITGREGGEVPRLVVDIVHFLGAFMGEEGLFRLSGQVSVFQAAKQALEAGEPVAFGSGPYRSPHDAASLLKLWLRELPVPLLSFELHGEFVALGAGGDGPGLVALTGRLPPCHRATLVFLLRFLGRVAERAEENRMGCENLGVVFGPSLMRARVDDDPFAALRELPLYAKVVALLIERREDV